jgi:hypothetical protein
MRHDPPAHSAPPSAGLIALLVVGAVGLALIAVGVTGQSGWWLIGPGFLALAVSLVGAWRVQRSRDRFLR